MNNLAINLVKIAKIANQKGDNSVRHKGRKDFYDGNIRLSTRKYPVYIADNYVLRYNNFFILKKIWQCIA